jgi:hypothetical protein
MLTEAFQTHVSLALHDAHPNDHLFLSLQVQVWELFWKSLQHAVGSDRPQQLLLGTAAGFSPRHRPAVSQERAHRLRG